MRMVKRIAVGCMAALCIASTLCGNVYSAEEDKPTSYEWKAIYRNFPGAPSSAVSEPDIFTIYHVANGAKVTTRSAKHVIAGAIGTTIIDCKNYQMATAKIKETDSKKYAYVKPVVGTPIKNIPVEYMISAYTDTTSDAFETDGVIVKQ